MTSHSISDAVVEDAALVEKGSSRIESVGEIGIDAYVYSAFYHLPFKVFSNLSPTSFSPGSKKPEQNGS